MKVALVSVGVGKKSKITGFLDLLYNPTNFKVVDSTGNFLKPQLFINARKQTKILHFSMLDYLWRMRRLRKMLWLPYCIYVLAFLLALKHILRYKIVSTMIHIQPHEPMFIDTAMYKAFLKNSHIVVAYTKYIADYLIADFNLPNSKIHVCPDPNFSTYCPCQVTREKARQLLAYPCFSSDDFVVLFLGTIRPYKGLHYLLSAFQKIENLKIKLLILGKFSDHPQLRSYREKVQKQIVMTPRCTHIKKWIPDGQLQDYLKAADVACLPEYNVVSATILTFMQFKLPVILPSLKPWQIYDNGNIIFFKNKSIADLKKKILWAYSNRHLLERMGDNGHSHLKRWNPTRVSKQLYNTILKVKN